MPIDMTQVAAWLKQADVIYQTPLIRMALVPLLKALLPPLGVTPEQIAVLDEHAADYDRRKAEAERRTRLDS